MDARTVAPPTSTEPLAAKIRSAELPATSPDPLENGRAPLRRTDAETGALLHLAGRFGLPALLVAVFALFSVWRPDGYFTRANVDATLSQQAIVMMVAFGALVPLIIGEFDLSVGANAGMAGIFSVGLSSLQGWNSWLAIAGAVAISTFVGLVNGLIVTRLNVNSFVATLGTATAVGGVCEWYTNSQDLQSAPKLLQRIGQARLFDLPTLVWVTLGTAIALGIVLQALVFGRRLQAVGANRRAAELTGIRPDRHVVLAFVICGAIVGLGGALYGANLGAASLGTGPTLLLPAFAGAFLGSTTITPGKYNVTGTIVAVLLLAFSVSGLEQVGVKPWIQEIIQGAALVSAVAFSSWAARRRTARLRALQLAHLAEDRPQS